MDVPRVSVIMPVYNSAPFLRESINSVLDQTFRDFELIAIDDGSTDRSWEIVRSFNNDRRVRSIRHETNQGAATARNDGIAASDSDYIAFLDSDDLAKPQRLEVQVRAMERPARFDIIFGRAEILRGGERWRGSFGRISSGDVPSQLLFRNCIAHSSVMMRRSCWQLFRPEFEPAEDYDLWARVAHDHSFLPLSDVLVIYREHPDGVSKRLPDRMKKSVTAIHAFQLERFGVEPRVDLHGRLSSWPADASAYDLGEAERWLRELVEANRAYSETNFRRVVEVLWYSICLDSWSAGPLAFQIYRRSSLAKLTPHRLWNFARRFGRRALHF
jgi:glycosyltransferase involved in cell wall biosynthesis